VRRLDVEAEMGGREDLVFQDRFDRRQVHAFVKLGRGSCMLRTTRVAPV
jgi:hypothetical protein